MAQAGHSPGGKGGARSPEAGAAPLRGAKAPRGGKAPRGPKAPRGATAWALYDFANTIFSMNVLTMYLAQWIVVDRGVEDVWYSLAYSVSMALVAITLPVLGALADQAAGGRVRFLLGFTMASVLGTALIGLAAQGHSGAGAAAPQGNSGVGAVAAALVAFAIANYAFQGSLVFYNALLPVVSTPATIGRVSGFGVALGYVGSIAGLLLVSPFVDGKLPFVGTPLPWPPAGGRAAAFYPTAVFFALFSTPLFLRIRTDRVSEEARGGGSAGGRGGRAAEAGGLKRAIHEVWQGLKDTGRFPGVRRFLIANYLFVDAINTVILFMAVYAQEVMGMPDSIKIQFFVVATTGAVIGSLLLGRASDRLGPRRVLSWVLVGWIVALASVAITKNTGVFWAAGVLVGICLGGTWTTSRALLANLTPPAAHGRFFGLYALSDKAAAVIGPLVWGLVVWAGRPLGPLRYRMAVGTLVLFVLAGWVLLRKVPESRGEVGPASL